MDMNLAQTLSKAAQNDPHGKDWEDLTYDERTDRLMEVVTQLHNTVQLQARQLDTLRDQIRQHEHDEDGDVFQRHYLSEKHSTPYMEAISGPYRKYNSNPLNSKVIKANLNRHEGADAPSSSY